MREVGVQNNCTWQSQLFSCRLLSCHKKTFYKAEALGWLRINTTDREKLLTVYWTAAPHPHRSQHTGRCKNLHQTSVNNKHYHHSHRSRLFFVCLFVCSGSFITKVHSHRHSTTDNSTVARSQRKASGPGSRLGAAVTLSRSFRWSHGLNTSLPSPSRLSFRHCSFSMSMRWYSPYSRPLSAGSCSPAQPQPCPWPCPWPDIVEYGAASVPQVPVRRYQKKTVRLDHDPTLLKVKPKCALVR